MKYFPYSLQKPNIYKNKRDDDQDDDDDDDDLYSIH